MLPKSINSYFAPLTQDQIERNELLSAQQTRAKRNETERKRLLAEEAALKMNENILLAGKVALKGNENVVDLTEYELESIGGGVRNAVQEMLSNLDPVIVTTSNVETPTATKRISNS